MGSLYLGTHSFRKQGHQLQTAKNSQCLLSVTSNWELELKQGRQLGHCRFRLEKQQCHTCLTLFLHICQPLLDDDIMKMANFTFVEDGNTRQQLSRSFPERLFSPSEFNSKKFANIQGCQK